jgi:hypothetical protein
METSASFEARSAPLPYPTGDDALTEAEFHSGQSPMERQPVIELFQTQ